MQRLRQLVIALETGPCLAACSRSQSRSRRAGPSGAPSVATTTHRARTGQTAEIAGARTPPPSSKRARRPAGSAGRDAKTHIQSADTGPRMESATPTLARCASSSPECTSSPSLRYTLTKQMHEVCPLSCGLCTTPCKDLSPACDRWAMSGRLVSPSSHSLDPKKLRELFKP